MGSASKKEASKQTESSVKPLFASAVGICFIRRMALPIGVKQIFKGQISGKLKNNLRSEWRKLQDDPLPTYRPFPLCLWLSTSKKVKKKKKSLDGLRQMLSR